MIKLLHWLVAATTVVGCQQSVPASTGITDIAIQGFETSEPDVCRESDAAGTTSEVEAFFRQAQVISARELHDRHDFAPCRRSGTLTRNGQHCRWELRPGGVGSLQCGSDEAQSFACERCLDTANTAAAEASKTEVLILDEEPLESACSDTHRAALRDELAKIVLDKSRFAAAHKLLQTLLCLDSSDDNVQYVYRHLRSEVRQGEAGTGQASANSTIRRSPEYAKRLMRDGSAWQASVTNAEGALVLDFRPDEACLTSYRLQAEQSDWRVSEVSSACD